MIKKEIVKLTDVCPADTDERPTEWGTPDALFCELNAEFGFTTDVCASAGNHKCPVYFDKETDGLAQEWGAVNWCNPPHSRDIPKWCRKAMAEADKGKVTVMLLPVRTDTRWFHEYCLPFEVRFLPGRLKFKGAAHVASYPSMILVLKKKEK